MTRAAKVIVTLGPASDDEATLRALHRKGVDFVRVAMPHSTVEQLEAAIDRATAVGIPFILDTEGSQIRTGDVAGGTLDVAENSEVRLWVPGTVGAGVGGGGSDGHDLVLHPGAVVGQLEPGDLLHIDFDTLILRVSDTAPLRSGFVRSRAVAGGSVGSNKAVVVDPVLARRFDLPALSATDHRVLQTGLAKGVGHVAVSFARSAAVVDEVRRLTGGRMKVIAKIECVDGLQALDEIAAAADYLLVDRGDLSKEIPIERVPFTQKVVVERARRHGTPVFVATNLLETMITKRKPTRAEVHDVISTVVDGAAGLTLSGETALGVNPLGSVNMLVKLIDHAEGVLDRYGRDPAPLPLVGRLADGGYELDLATASSLVAPHGGRLVNRVLTDPPAPERLRELPSVVIDANRQMDVHQIAIGTYSPVEGFLGSADLEAVLTGMRLADGTPWPIPVVLDVDEEVAAGLALGGDVALADEHGDVLAVLHLDEKHRVDHERMARLVYGTVDPAHPGVRMVMGMRPVLLGGPIDLVRRRRSATMEYELSPRQTRRLFDERGWATVLGFHTRNVIHRGHEFIQREALEREGCDGLFVHPIVGKKKPGDFEPEYIIRSYELMMRRFYPPNRVVLATFCTFSRYAGPREALFTALCRKNFGCSHFIVGRDHTGVGSYYPPRASQEIFDRFPDLGITPVMFGEVFYSRRAGAYVHKSDDAMAHPADDKLGISGTQARSTFQRGEMPPDWFMRPEIAQIILDAVGRGERVFVTSEDEAD